MNLILWRLIARIMSHLLLCSTRLCVILTSPYRTRCAELAAEPEIESTQKCWQNLTKLTIFVWSSEFRHIVRAVSRYSYNTITNRDGIMVLPPGQLSGIWFSSCRFHFSLTCQDEENTHPFLKGIAEENLTGQTGQTWQQETYFYLFLFSPCAKIYSFQKKFPS